MSKKNCNLQRNLRNYSCTRVLRPSPSRAVRAARLPVRPSPRVTMTLARTIDQLKIEN